MYNGDVIMVFKIIKDFMYWRKNRDKWIFHSHCNGLQASYDGFWRCMICVKAHGRWM
jgi:hypothetical protein